MNFDGVQMGGARLNVVYTVFDPPWWAIVRWIAWLLGYARSDRRWRRIEAKGEVEIGIRLAANSDETRTFKRRVYTLKR